MLIRALIVFLAILNLGVAAWWLLRPDASTPTAAVASGIPTIELASETAADPQPVHEDEPTEDAAAGSAPAVVPVAALVAPAATAEVMPPVVEAAPRCLALGPYPTGEAARAAVSALGAQVQRSKLREQASAAAAYTVFLPAMADRATAQATAQKITAAGFTDLLVLGSGEQANSIALGRYSSLERAEQRQAALRAAGFPAQMQPVGAPANASWWADVAVLGQTSANGRSIDCARLR